MRISDLLNGYSIEVLSSIKWLASIDGDKVNGNFFRIIKRMHGAQTLVMNTLFYYTEKRKEGDSGIEAVHFFFVFYKLVKKSCSICMAMSYVHV